MVTSSAPYRVALIGCGDIAETGHLPALLAHPRFDLVALCDIRPKRAALLSSQGGGIPTCADYRPLLDRPDLDAVILALHPEHSVDVAIDCLRAGKAVLDEKPLAVTMVDGRRLARVVETTCEVYQIGFAFRYCRFVSRVARYAMQIGTPAIYRVGIYDERLDSGDAEHFARIQSCLKASSAVTHEGSHVLDYLQAWNDSPVVRAQAVSLCTDAEFEGPNLWSAQLGLADGSVLCLEIGWLLADLPPSTLSITGPHGFLSIDLGSATLGSATLFCGSGRFIHGGTTEILRLEPLAQDWAGQLDAFAEAIERGPVPWGAASRSGRATAATVYDGLRSLAGTLACEQSARSGRTIEVDEVHATACSRQVPAL